MCGIAAIINISNNKSHINKLDLIKMSYALKSRGPDSKGEFISKKKNIALAVRRLSTQDSRNIANQPCESSDRSIVAILNGEIYNHNELRKELILLGFRFKSNNDTEVLANGFKAWREKILDKISGQYAFVIYDKISEESFIARDPSGISPMFYTLHDKRIIIGSTVKSILSINCKNFKLYKPAIVDFFLSDSVSNGNTFFKDIKYLRGGFYIKIDKNKSYKIKSFKKINKNFIEYKRLSTEKEYINKIHEILESSVSKTLQGDKKVGLFLSGGIDSVSIMALIRKISPNTNIKTFSAAFEDPSSKNIVGETLFAKKMSDYYNCDFNEVVVSQDDLINNLKNTEQPQASFIEATIDKLSKRSSEMKTNIALSGEGIDEMFLGYDHFLASIGNLDNNFSFLKKKYSLRGESNKLVKSKKKKLTNIFLGGGVNIDLIEDLNLLLNINISEKNRFKNYILKLYNEISNDKIKSDVGQQMMYIDYSNKVAENLLRRAEGPAMNNGVEMRFPYLMDDLLDFAYKIPLHFKIGSGETKYLFRKTLEGIVHPDAVRRPKSPFALPGVRSKHYKNAKLNFGKPAFKDIIYNNKKYIYEIFNEGSFNKEKLINIGFFNDRLAMQKSKKTSFFDGLIWKMWNFAEWYEKNI